MAYINRRNDQVDTSNTLLNTLLLAVLHTTKVLEECSLDDTIRQRGSKDLAGGLVH